MSSEAERRSDGKSPGWTSWRTNLVAAVWGFAEATLFFLVPDVFLTYVAAKRTRLALIASVFAVAGALAGGALMYGWGLYDQAGASAALDRMPAISPGMLERVENDLAKRGLVAAFIGPFTGKPYKVYAVKSAGGRIGLPSFMAVSIPARLIRFVLASLIVGWISRTVLKKWPLSRKRMALTVFWLLFYAAFFSLMPS